MDPHSRAPKKNTSHGYEVLLQDTMHLIPRPCYQRGSPCQDPAGPHEDLLTIVKRRKLQWYGHVPRSQSLVAKTILQGTVKGEEDFADKGGGGKTTSGNGQAWSSPSPRGQWKTKKMEETGCEIICVAPTTLAVKG